MASVSLKVQLLGISMLLNKSVITPAFFVSLLIASLALPASARTQNFNFTCSTNTGVAMHPVFEATGADKTHAPSYGFSYSYGQGNLTISQEAGIGSGVLSLATSFLVSGNMTAYVTIDRANINGSEMGLGVSDVYGRQLLDVFTTGMTGVNSNVFNEGGGLFSWGRAYPTGEKLKFFIARTDGKITGGYVDALGNIIAVNSSPANKFYKQPLSIYLFQIEEYGNVSAHTGIFSNLSITSKSLNNPCALDQL